MSVVASRDLRNHTADVLRRVADGETVTVTVHGEPVAEIQPIRRRKPQTMTSADFVARFHQADPGLRTELAQLDADTIDDLDPDR